MVGGWSGQEGSIAHPALPGGTPVGARSRSESHVGAARLLQIIRTGSDADALRAAEAWLSRVYVKPKETVAVEATSAVMNTSARSWSSRPRSGGRCCALRRTITSTRRRSSSTSSSRATSGPARTFERAVSPFAPSPSGARRAQVAEKPVGSGPPFAWAVGLARPQPARERAGPHGDLLCGATPSRPQQGDGATESDPGGWSGAIPTSARPVRSTAPPGWRVPPGDAIAITSHTKGGRGQRVATATNAGSRPAPASADRLRPRKRPPRVALSIPVGADARAAPGNDVGMIHLTRRPPDGVRRASRVRAAPHVRGQGVTAFRRRDRSS